MKALSYFFLGLMLISWLTSTMAVMPVNAESNQINLSKFGYGARIDPWGEEVDIALKATSDAALDWISIDFDWERHWPDQSSTLNLVEFNKTMSYARDHNLGVLISITHAPTWARSSNGPDAELTAGLVTQLVRLYPDTLLAVELFPSANTFQGWGAKPNPEAYSVLLKVIASKLEASDKSTLLVAAGLEPVLAANASSPDMDDLEFLQGLYSAEANKYFSIIGIRIPVTGQAPLAPPWKADPRVLRHYESVRSVMLKNRHSEGRIWVTSFLMPGSKLPSSKDALSTGKDMTGTGMTEQASWLNQAMALMKSQLYIGAVFYGCLNPPVGGSGTVTTSCLIQTEESIPRYHPAYLILSQMIALDKSSTLPASSQNGRFNQLDQKVFLKSGVP